MNAFIFFVDKDLFKPKKEELKKNINFFHLGAIWKFHQAFACAFH
jgi:hypothetical protein